MLTQSCLEGMCWPECSQALAGGHLTLDGGTADVFTLLSLWGTLPLLSDLQSTLSVGIHWISDVFTRGSGTQGEGNLSQVWRQS